MNCTSVSGVGGVFIKGQSRSVLRILVFARTRSRDLVVVSSLLSIAIAIVDNLLLMTVMMTVTS